MAVTWGSWVYGSDGNGMRVGIEVVGTAVGSNSSSFTATFRVYTSNKWRYSDPQTLNWSGCPGSGSMGFNNTQDRDPQTLRHTLTCTRPYQAHEYGSSPGNLALSVNVTATYNGVVPSCSVSVPIPARSVLAPNPPSWASASRVSDQRVDVSWGHNDVLSPQRPMESATVQRMMYQGSTWSEWSSVAMLTGKPSTYTDAQVSANQMYRYRVCHGNTAGSSTWAETAEVPMTPGAPTQVSAAFSQNSGRVAVGWVSTAYASSAVTYEVERSVAAAPFVRVASGLPSTAVQWVDPSPGGGLNVYRVRAVYGSLTSAWVQSNGLASAVAPLAPTNLVPDGGTLVDLDADALFSWVHRSGGDGAPQSAAEVRFSRDGGVSWNPVIPVSGSSPSLLLLKGFLSNGSVFLWQVRTQGDAGPGFGPWSASARFTTPVPPPVSLPTLLLTAPPPQVEGAPLTVAWLYSQEQQHPQAGWEAKVLDGSGVVVSEASGAGTATSTVFTDPLEDGASYTVRVRVRSSDDLWSEWASRSVQVLGPGVEPEPEEPPGEVDPRPGRWKVWDGLDWVPSDLRLAAGVYRSAGDVVFEQIPWVAAHYSKTVSGDVQFERYSFSYRSFTGTGSPDPDAVPGGGCWHGFLSTDHGAHHGFVWFPALPPQFTCVGVGVSWRATHVAVPQAKLAIGYHVLPRYPSQVVYSDPRISRALYEVGNGSLQPMSMDLDRVGLVNGQTVSMADLVNRYRDGNFGLVFGHDYTQDQAFYGRGMMLRVVYLVKQDMDWVV